MTGGGGDTGELGGATDSTNLPGMLRELRDLTGVDFAAQQAEYSSFAAAAESSILETRLADALFELHEGLRSSRILGTIGSIDSWADGSTNFRIVSKSWPSVVDKLYRLNIEENELAPNPPFLPNLHERVAGASYSKSQQWITPSNVSEFADDLVRTKFVVPFVDGVIQVSDKIKELIYAESLPRYVKYHAKDSGYHARHLYCLLEVPAAGGGSRTVALEIKVLTKLQDTLGELTHLLYEAKRTGRIPSEKKRKLAWMIDSPDFLASYVGHSAHFIEAQLVILKSELMEMEAE
ncbi:hypothetical protein [Pedococcus aerophilus]|uniref:hypothetical protein n=1 Tax=Pedococcus aerophilus TaxID=436356 RepID=UPI0031DC9845